MDTSHFKLSSNSSENYPQRYFSPRVFLAGIGQKLRQINLFKPIAQKVIIKQKSVHNEWILSARSLW